MKSTPSASLRGPVAATTSAPAASRSYRVVGFLRRAARRPAAIPAAGLASAADVFLPILPSQTLLIACTLLHPARWLSTALWFLLGGTLLATALNQWGPLLLETAMPDLTASSGWHRILKLVHAHGARALLGLAALPFPVRIAIAVCALSGVPLWHIILALGGGRGFALSSLAWVSSRFPRLLQRLPDVRRLMKEVHAGSGRQSESTLTTFRNRQ